MGPEYGLKLMIPNPSKDENRSKLGVALYGLVVDRTQDANMVLLTELVKDLVSVKRVGGIFLTDLGVEKGDVYGAWSSYWLEFVESVARNIPSKVE